tara:strand:+ start:5555 stop:6181 length:627 start_codon:yes stop_codon:yes gene_type:complete
MTNSPAENTLGQTGGLWNLWFGLAVLGFVVLCLALWFPRDIGSGFLQKNLTGRTVPGDAFFPVILVLLMVPLAGLLVFSQLRGGTARGGEQVGRIGLNNLLFLGRAGLVTALSLLVMNQAGPVIVWATNAAGLTDASGYRALSGTFPFNVMGFFVGGTLLTCAFLFITRHELRVRVRDVLIAVEAAASLILIFAGLLDNVQLPPNADL